jgi:hypothetical protein
VKEILMLTSTPYDVDVLARGEVDAYDALVASGCEAPGELELDTDVSLTVLVQGSGTVGRHPAARSYDPGTVVTLQAKPRPGWTFASWRGPCAGKRQTCRLTLSRSVTVTAVFRRQPGTSSAVLADDAGRQERATRLPDAETRASATSGSGPLE